MKKLVILFAVFTIFSSCNKHKTSNIDEYIEINKVFKVNAHTKNDTSFIFLNSLPETYNYLDNFIPNARKTSNVHFNYGKDTKAIEHYHSVNNNVNVYKLPNDSLVISIGTGDGYTGYGVTIKIHKNIFLTNYYKFDDMISYDDIRPKQTILYQDLILDKPNYELNDSLYGFINFRSLYIGKREDTLYVNAIGHFRGKVKEIER